MNISLYPYNYYILLASCVLVIISLVILLLHFNTLAHTLEKQEKTIQNINSSLKDVQFKTNALNAKKKESHKNDKTLKLLLPILLAIYSTYRNDSELKGIKGYRKAASRVIKKNMNNNPLGFFKQFM